MITLPIPGTLYTFPLANGLYGACRVIRGPSAEEAASYDGHTLVCATRWVGQPATVLMEADTKTILKAANGAALYWVAGFPPTQFTAGGVIATPKADLAKRCNTTAPWEIFPNIVYQTWQRENDPEAAVARCETNEEAGRHDHPGTHHEQVDLTGFVPLAMPKAERTPDVVLRGFFAAMNQWEMESERISKKLDAGAVTRFNRTALQAIFDEFCTPKDRSNGRLGSYSSPPEYDPAQEEVLGVTAVGPRRVEIETQQRSGFKHRIIYSLLKVNGMWLIDGRKVEGRSRVL